MKVIVLIENTSKCSLCAEHGLSVYIEYNGMKYLLDTGASDTFSANAHQLGINLADIDIAFLSQEIDNNPAERMMKPICMGRKNYLFCGSELGAKNASMLYSIIETCKMNGLRPVKYKIGRAHV